MLIKFTCENFLSFGDGKNGFEFVNLAASKTKSLPSHVLDISSEISVLRGAAIYGANAAGKSNFIKAIDFARKLVLSSENIEKHNLGAFQNKFCKGKKSRFSFDFKLGDVIYEYGFEITSSEVIAEWLRSTNLNGKREKTLFERDHQEIASDKEIAAIVKKDKGADFYKYVKKAISPNQLFLNRLANDNVKFASDVLDWFKKIAFVRVFNHSIFFKKKELSEFATKLLKKIDRQIDEVSFDKAISIDKPSEIGLPQEASEGVFNHLLELYKAKKKEISVQIKDPKNNKKIYLSIDEKGIKQFEILVIRKNKEFSLDQESDGIRRIFDLIPMLFAANSKNSEKLDSQSIFIVDEIEKSLHPFIAKEVVSMFLEFGTDCESQLIFTTHDTNLLDLELMRKDEIWFAEKDKNLNTKFTSLAEFKNIREDLVVSKGYLQGRFGAIPFIGKVGE